ncbi:MAG: tRNA (adenosine(37)-N6)-dimethylallyltransferase MiaA [Bacteroidetes bacterium]|nr:tRNA (adenosine(37)-N6)-dimethylallyltransferase MiaA [Bacteroidota bacterium]
MNTLISIVGPTGVGKTSLSLSLAQRFGTVIVSTDSRQMYRLMDIGTAKPNEKERSVVPHYFINTLNPDENYNAAKFEEEAEAILSDLFKTNPVVISVGGSTLYIDALWHGFDDMPSIPAEIRDTLNHQFQTNGLTSLVEELEKVDPVTFAQIDQANPARVIRALEIFRATGTPISTFRKGKKKKIHPYRLIKIALYDEREVLYERINQRVQEMVELGLESEVRDLLEQGYSRDLPSMQSIGYREMADYISGEISYDEAIRLIQRNSRRYAKRQLTWFRRYDDVNWFQAGENEKIIQWLEKQMG